MSAPRPFSRRLRPPAPGARVALAALTILAGCGGEAPEERPAREPGGSTVERPSFDGARAFGHLERQVSFGPRVPGTEGHARQLEWMVAHLAERADGVAVDSFTHVTAAGDTLRLRNVRARFDGPPGRRLLLLTHWDTRPRSDQASDPEERELPVPGANDGASGTAVLLELAELLSRQPPPVPVELLFVDGEDYGPDTGDMFLGSRHYARATLTEDSRPTYGVLLDMVGDRDPLFPVEGYSAQWAPSVVRRVWQVARELGYGDRFPLRVGPPVMDDHVILNEAGLPTVDVIDLEYGPGNRLWHTPRDVPANTSSASLEMVGEVMAELIYRGG